MTLAASPAQRTVLISANSAWNIAHFRKPVLEALVASGWRVIAVAPGDGAEGLVTALGAEFVPVRMQPGGTSVWADARLFADYLRVFRKYRPGAFLGFTVKPNVYGSLAAHLCGTKAINTISGLGTAFIRPGLLNRLVRSLYRFALAKSATVFFQNRHDRDLFIAEGLVRHDQAHLVPGSGIDLQRFQPQTNSSGPDGAFRFLFIGRLLRDKGVVEFAEAARMLRQRWPEVEFAMLGPAGSDNPTAVPIAEVERWADEGILIWLGESDDVRPFLAQADCVVLPSYREGLPRSLLEAGAMAKPMIATDVPGCVEVVTHDETGLLCQVRSATSLATAMEAMLRLSPDDRAALGANARRKVEGEFDQSRVVQAYLEALQ